ncbi:MAG TPA: hypothetical protein VD994_06910 [Prosthecobacter sp.]|nr:hypothetical protein [Prosthecobacter sp.]
MNPPSRTALFSAGLGDVIRRIYTSHSYQFISEVKDRIPVIVASHNPFSIEIFRHHRNARNFLLLDLGHKYDEFLRAGLKGPEITRAIMDFAGYDTASQVLGSRGDYQPLFDAPDRLPSEGHIVFCPFSGGGPRTFTQPFMHRVAECLWRSPCQIYVVTRSFPRNRQDGKNIHAEEDARMLEGGNIKVLDNLTVPASLDLIRNSRAYVGSWSSLHQAAWFENKPVAVFYPKDWTDVKRRTGYAFGLDRDNCFHSDYESVDFTKFEGWLDTVSE